MVSFFKKLPIFVKLILVLATITLGFYSLKLAANIVEQQPYYRLKKVKIHGLINGDADQILKEIGLNKNTDLLSINKVTLKKKLLKIARIADAEIKIKYPDAVTIMVRERMPSFLLKTKNQLASVTKKGVLVAEGDEVVELNNLVLIVNQAPNLDYALKTKLFKNFIRFFNQLNPHEKNIQEYFSDVILEDEIIFHGRGDNLTINLGGDLTLEKMRKVYYAYLYYKEKNLSTNFIDLRGRLVKFKFNDKI